MSSMFTTRHASQACSRSAGCIASSAAVTSLQGGRVAVPVPTSHHACSCGRRHCRGHALHTAAVASPSTATTSQQQLHASGRPDPSDLGARHQMVLEYFPKSLSADDYMARVEIALAGYGFTGDNTIAMSNLCRDESCMVLEDKIESVFGSCFSTHGLGGVLTCGVIGIKAGLSHSPVQDGKERYVFFSFPHVAIDSDGNVGCIARPNRPGASSACGALIAVTRDLKEQGVEANCRQPGVHDPLEPEYSILKQRLARRLAFERIGPKQLDLVMVTQAAERTITSDLEYLIEKAVSPAKADYAVFTGVQIHNWASDLDDPSIPSLEFVCVGKSYVVQDGVKHYLDLHKVPALSPRQLRALSTASTTNPALAAASSAGGMIAEIPRDYLLQRLGGAASSTTVVSSSASSPSWQEYVRTTYREAHPNAPRMDTLLFEVAPPAEDEWFNSFKVFIPLEDQNLPADGEEATVDAKAANQ